MTPSAGWTGRSRPRGPSSTASARAVPRRRSSTGSRSTTTAPPTPLKNMATIGVPEPRMITVQPFDPTQIKAIEKAVQESDLGLTPSNDGKLIRLPIPQLTEERRKELVKLVRRYGEEGKIAIRNVRRDVMKHLEELVRNGEVGDDEELRGEKQVQKLTDDETVHAEGTDAARVARAGPRRRRRQARREHRRRRRRALRDRRRRGRQRATRTRRRTRSASSSSSRAAARSWRASWRCTSRSRRPSG